MPITQVFVEETARSANDAKKGETKSRSALVTAAEKQAPPMDCMSVSGMGTCGTHVRTPWTTVRVLHHALKGKPKTVSCVEQGN